MDWPTVETERLVLRGHRAEDFPASFALWSDPEVVRFITGRPSTREEAWSRLLRHVGHWHLLGFGYWAVEDRQSGLMIGEVGFGSFKRTIAPSLEDYAEIGWVLDPAQHGRGLASEAVARVLAWADATLPMPATACIVSPENAPSLRVAAKQGYAEFARTAYAGSPVVLLRRPRGGG